MVGVPFIAWVMLKLIKELKCSIPSSKLVGVACLIITFVAIALSVRTVFLFERFAS